MPRHSLTALTLLACACSSDTGSAPSHGGTVRATIYGAPSWGDVVVPLSGVAVDVANHTEFTNDLGIAYLTDLATGTNALHVERDGSEPIDSQIVVVSGDTVDLVRELMPVRPGTGRMEVRVGVPAAPGSPDTVYPPSAVVTLDQSVRLTDGDGRAEFPFVAAGGHQVRAEYPGALPDSTIVEILGGDTVRVAFVLELAPPP